jgi:hypothetical protein
VPSTIPGTGGQVAPGAETTGNAQVVSALGAPFVLEGLFGEADAAMDAEPEAEGSFTGVGMDVEDEIAADGSMVIDDDPYVPSLALHIETGKKVDWTDARYDGDPTIDRILPPRANASEHGRPPARWKRNPTWTWTRTWYARQNVCAALPCATLRSRLPPSRCAADAKSGLHGANLSAG